MAKRILALIACLALFLTVSCAESPNLLSFMPEETDENDLNGIELRLKWDLGGISVSYEIDTPQYDAFVRKLHDLENEFNCTIIHGDKLPERNFDIDLMSGAYTYDIYLGNITHYAEGGYMYPMTAFDGKINPYDEKYGGTRVLEAGMINGIPYGVSPISWPGFEPARGFIISYNRDLFNEHNITDLHEYYENDIWTYDTFENEFLANVNIQDKNGDTIYALATHGTNMYLSLLLSNDVKFVKENADGTLSADPTSKSFINAMTWGQGIFSKYGHILKGEENTHEHLLYRSQKSLCATAYPYQVITGNIAYNDLSTFVAGVMPFPCGPDATYGEWGQVIDAFLGFGIPITAQSPEAAALIIDNLCEPYEEFGGDAGLSDYYQNNIFSTELDAEIFIASYQHPRSSYIGRDDGQMDDVRESVGSAIVNPSKSLTEVITSMQGRLTELIEEHIIPNYRAVYGE